MRDVVRYCAVDASIPVLSAKLVFVNAAVCTPLTVCVWVACARHDAAATVWVWTRGRTSRSVSQDAARTSRASKRRAQLCQRSRVISTPRGGLVHVCRLGCADGPG